MKIYTEYWKMCRALANPVRLRMLRLLIDNGELKLQDFTRIVGCAESTASMYMTKLQDVGMVTKTIEKGMTIYLPIHDLENDTAKNTLLSLRQHFATIPAPNIIVDSDSPILETQTDTDSDSRMLELKNVAGVDIEEPMTMFSLLSNERRMQVLEVVFENSGKEFPTIAKKTPLPYLTFWRHFEQLCHGGIISEKAIILKQPTTFRQSILNEAISIFTFREK